MVGVASPCRMLQHQESVDGAAHTSGGHRFGAVVDPTSAMQQHEHALEFVVSPIELLGCHSDRGGEPARMSVDMISIGTRNRVEGIVARRPDGGIADDGGEPTNRLSGDDLTETVEPVDVGVERRGPHTQGSSHLGQRERLVASPIDDLDRGADHDGLAESGTG